jgi:hypothetical protein
MVWLGKLTRKELASRRAKIMHGAVLTDGPCKSETCWEATGLVCRCSCGGFNHGIAHDPERQEQCRQLYEGKPTLNSYDGRGGQ